MSKALGILNQPRVALEEFLRADARVVYEYLFSTRHVGRIIDLIMHEMRKFFDEGVPPEEAATLEYRMRSVLELAVFNAWSSYRKGEKVRSVSLEVGWDSERAIVMVSSLVDSDASAVAPESRIAKMLKQIKDQADGIVVRHSKETGGFQVIAFIDAPKPEVKSISEGLPDYLDLKEILVAAEAKPLGPESAEVASPEPLASADIKGFVSDEKQDEKDRLLLRNKREGKNTDKGEPEFHIKADSPIKDPEVEKQTSDIKMSGASEEAWLKKMVKERQGDAPEAKDLKLGDAKEHEPGVKTFAQQKAEQEAKAKKFAEERKQAREMADKTGPADEKEKEKTITLKTERIGDDQEAIKVGKTDVLEEGEMRVKSGAAPSEKDPATEITKLSGKETDDVEEAIQVLLNAVKAELVDLLPNLSETEFEEMFRDLSSTIRENFMQSAHHIGRLRTIQMVSKVKLYKDQIQLLTSKIEDLESKLASQGVEIKPVRGEFAVNNAAHSVESRFNNLIERFKQGIEKGEIPDTAKQWAHGMMEEIIRDKAEVNQKIRDVDAHLKKKEFDFKAKETSFKEQLRIKDEESRQKAFALDKTRESLQGALKQLDRVKKIVASNESEAELKHKIVVNEKLLATANENSSKMSKRIDELQKKWQDEFSMRSELQKDLSNSKRSVDDLNRKLADATVGKVDTKELSQISMQRDRAMKVVEELKKQNKELQEKMSGSPATQGKVGGSDQKKAAVATDAELKHRLDHANKLVKAMKEELDRTKKRYDDIKLAETNLKVELARAQAQIRTQDKKPSAKPAPKK